MATISRLTPGQIVWSVLRQPSGNTVMRQTNVFPVKIIEIAENHSYVLASWNFNPPRKYYQNQVKNWRIKKPAECLY